MSATRYGDDRTRRLLFTRVVNDPWVRTRHDACENGRRRRENARWDLTEIVKSPRRHDRRLSRGVAVMLQGFGCATVASLLHARGSQLEVKKRPRNQIPGTKRSHSPFSGPNGESWAKGRFSSQLDESLGRRPRSLAMTAIEIHLPRKLLPSTAG